MFSVLKLAISVYGSDNQLTVAIEEFSELIKEICKYKRGEDNRTQIVEEIADCYIMLTQLNIMFGVDMMELLKERDRKIERLRKRLSGGDE